MIKEEFLEVYRHSLAHILAKAVIEIFGRENVQYAIGPQIADGFYYDFILPRTVGNDDFKEIEDKMREILKRREAWTRKEVSKAEAMELFQDQKFKTELIADADGLFEVDVDRLYAVNDIEELMIATRHTSTAVHAGDKLAGMRVIPLVIREEKLDEAKQAAGDLPLLRLTPWKLKTAAIITTGSEVLKGLIQDQFTPVVKKKLAAFGIETVSHVLCGDDKDKIREEIQKAHDAGTDLICCTGGMSVDPDDRTPGAISESGVKVVTYGAPTLPGAMFCLGYFDDGTPVVGLPGCVMYAKSTVFDLVLPRLAAGVKLERKDFVRLGHGGLCLGCPVCHYPVCPFGKG